MKYYLDIMYQNGDTVTGVYNDVDALILCKENTALLQGWRNGLQGFNPNLSTLDLDSSYTLSDPSVIGYYAYVDKYRQFADSMRVTSDDIITRRIDIQNERLYLLDVIAIAVSNKMDEKTLITDYIDLDMFRGDNRYTIINTPYGITRSGRVIKSVTERIKHQENAIKKLDSLYIDQAIGYSDGNNIDPLYNIATAIAITSLQYAKNGKTSDKEPKYITQKDGTRTVKSGGSRIAEQILLHGSAGIIDRDDIIQSVYKAILSAIDCGTIEYDTDNNRLIEIRDRDKKTEKDDMSTIRSAAVTELYQLQSKHFKHGYSVRYDDQGFETDPKIVLLSERKYRLSLQYIDSNVNADLDQDSGYQNGDSLLDQLQVQIKPKDLQVLRLLTMTKQVEQSYTSNGQQKKRFVSKPYTIREKADILGMNKETVVNAQKRIHIALTSIVGVLRNNSKPMFKSKTYGKIETFVDENGNMQYIQNGFIGEMLSFISDSLKRSKVGSIKGEKTDQVWFTGKYNNDEMISLLEYYRDLCADINDSDDSTITYNIISGRVLDGFRDTGGVIQYHSGNMAVGGNIASIDFSRI